MDVKKSYNIGARSEAMY